MVQRAMPENSLLAVAAVLDEFLEFHHDIGVSAASIDSMYDNIINSLQQEEALPEESKDVEVENKTASSDDSRREECERPSTGSTLDPLDAEMRKAQEAQTVNE